MVMAPTQVQQMVRSLPDNRFPLIAAYAASELRSEQKETIRRDAQNAVLERLLQLAVVTETEQAIVHEIYPDDDLNAGAVAYNQWLSAALVAATVNAYANIALANNKTLCIYGFATDSASPAVALIRFAKGAGGLNTIARYQLQKVWCMQETYGFFSKTSLWDRVETVFVELLPFLAAAAGERFVLLGYTAEPVTEQVAGAIL